MEACLRGVMASRDAQSRFPRPFHFDEDDGVPLAEEQVQLPVAGPVAALDEDVAAPRKVAQRELCAPRARGPVAQGPTPA